MKPIQNSAVKERTRLRNENEANAQIMKIRNAEQQQQARIQSDAQQQEEHIQQQLSANLKPYQQLTDALAVIFIVVGVVGLFLFIPSAGFFSPSSCLSLSVCPRIPCRELVPLPQPL